jgi:hypothetical protein
MRRCPMVSRALVVMQLCKFLPPVAVPVETAEQLATIAEREGVTLQLVIRTILEGYAEGYTTGAIPAPTGPPAR